jgi:hypothetical protein
LSAEGRSLLGVFLDFHGLSREKVAHAASGSFNKAVPVAEAGTLFSEDASKSSKGRTEGP